MTLYSIHQATRDADLEARTTSAANKEAIANPVFGDSAFGQQLLAGSSMAWVAFQWPIAVDNEAAYESALANPEIERPGLDPSVITDAAISQGVQVHWPWAADEVPPT